MATTFANLVCHVVFSTKNREPLIREEIRDPLYEYMGGIIRGEGGVLLEVGGMPDHIHLLAKIKTDMAVATLVQKVKGKSSKWLNDGDVPFEWQAGYGTLSVSASLVDRVRQYIRLQEEHHRRVSFRDELVGLLRRHGIAYDERYLLG